MTLMNDSASIDRPRWACASSFWLKLIALAAMVCDHIGYTGLSSLWWLRLVGRAAFPIYVFLLVDGFYLTRSRARYAVRLLLFALVSEPFFDFMVTGGASFFSLDSQSVLFTLLICLGALCALDWLKRRLLSGEGRPDGWPRAESRFLFALAAAAAVAAGCLAADALSSDYRSWGVLLAAGFWLFRGSIWGEALSEAAVFCLIMPYIETTIPLFGGVSVGFYGFALLSLIPIALYNGARGPSGRALQYAFYAAYPAHMLLLSLLAYRA